MATVRRLFSWILARPLATMGAAGVGLAFGIALLVPTTHLLLTSAKGKSVAVVHLRPLAEPSRLYDSKGNLLAVASDADYRVSLPLAFMGPTIQHAVIDVEDNTFYYHGAIDIRSIFRAATADFGGHGSVQGGSTITQQLVKNSLLTPERSISRKLHEAVLAYRLEQQMTKNQILERYLNTVYFGNGAYGVEAAAQTYWGVHAAQLTPAEAALLAGMISNPAAYDPLAHPQAALHRRSVAIDDMVDNGNLTKAQAYLASYTPLPTKLAGPPVPPKTAFVRDVELGLLYDKSDFPKLGRTYGERFNNLFRGGLSITTTLDPGMQADAERAVANQLPDTGNKFTAAMVAIDPSNGFVRALVPGNSSANGYDAATGYGGSGGRHPGSSFKAFVLMAAMDNGFSPDDLVDGTSPCTYQPPHTKPTIIHNAEQGGGVITLQAATTGSVNCAFIHLGLAVGLDKVAEMAHRLGITSNVPQYAVTSIGGAEDVTPYQMASAYATIADEGVYHRPTTVSKVVDRQGNVLYEPNTKGAQVVSPQVARTVTQMLQQVVSSGTGTAANIYDHPVAGKTGTDDNFVNAWFVGYTRQLVAAVWMGAPSGDVPMTDVGGITVFGGTYPARIWHDFMEAAMSGLPALDFTAPDASAFPAAKFILAPDSPGQQVFQGVPGPPGPQIPPGLVPFPVPPTPAPPPQQPAPTTTTTPPDTTTTSP